MVVKDGPHAVSWMHADEVNPELVNFLGKLIAVVRSIGLDFGGARRLSWSGPATSPRGCRSVGHGFALSPLLQDQLQ